MIFTFKEGLVSASPYSPQSSRNCTFFLFWYHYGEKKHSLSYKTAGLNQHWCIGILVAILATVLTELTTILGIKISFQTSPFWSRWFRSVTIVFICQSIACFLSKIWANLLLSLINKIYWKLWFLALIASTMASNSAHKEY